MSETCNFIPRINLKKLVHLVGFIVRKIRHRTGVLIA
jgi:hypothetical protein